VAKVEPRATQNNFILPCEAKKTILLRDKEWVRGLEERIQKTEKLDTGEKGRKMTGQTSELSLLLARDLSNQYAEDKEKI